MWLLCLFLESRVFLVSNLLLSIVESSLVGLSILATPFVILPFDILTDKPDIISRSCPQSSYPTFSSTVKVSKNLGLISGYLVISFLFFNRHNTCSSTVIPNTSKVNHANI